MAHAPSIGNPVLYFYVSAALTRFLKITKINTKRGRIVYIRDSITDTLPTKQHARVYTRDELIDLIDGPLAARFAEGGENLPILRKINCYVYGDGTCTPNGHCIHMCQPILLTGKCTSVPDASTFSIRELKSLYDTRNLLLSSPKDTRSALAQMLEQVNALFAPRPENDDKPSANGPPPQEQPLKLSPPAHEQDQSLVASLLSAVLNDRLDRSAILYHFITDQLKAANHPKHYAQYSSLVLEFAAVLKIRCGARAGRLLRGPGLADPTRPRFNFFWPSDRTCEREIKKRMPGNVIGFDYDAVRRVVTVMVETEDKTGIIGFFCLQMDATDVGSGAITCTADSRLINGSDLGNLSELAFADYPLNDHAVKKSVEDTGKRWELLLSKASESGVDSGALAEFFAALGTSKDLVSQSAGEIKAAHVKQYKAKVDADPSNPLLTSFADPSTPVEFLADKVKPGRKQVNQAQACVKLRALIELTVTYVSIHFPWTLHAAHPAVSATHAFRASPSNSHLAELDAAWEQASLIMSDQRVNNIERLDRLNDVVHTIKALSVYAVKPAGKLVCFSITDCHYRASAVVARIFVPSEREDVIEHIFQFISSELEVMTGQRNLTRRFVCCYHSHWFGIWIILTFLLHLALMGETVQILLSLVVSLRASLRSFPQPSSRRCALPKPTCSRIKTNVSLRLTRCKGPGESGSRSQDQMVLTQS